MNEVGRIFAARAGPGRKFIQDLNTMSDKIRWSLNCSLAQIIACEWLINVEFLLVLYCFNFLNDFDAFVICNFFSLVEINKNVLASRASTFFRRQNVQHFKKWQEWSCLKALTSFLELWIQSKMVLNDRTLFLLFKKNTILSWKCLLLIEEVSAKSLLTQGNGQTTKSCCKVLNSHANFLKVLLNYAFSFEELDFNFCWKKVLKLTKLKHHNVYLRMSPFSKKRLFTLERCIQKTRSKFKKIPTYFGTLNKNLRFKKKFRFFVQVESEINGDSWQALGNARAARTFVN